MGSNQLELAQLIGCRVKKDIINEFGTVIITVGTVFKNEHIPKIMQNGIHLTEIDFVIEKVKTVNSTNSAFLIQEATSQIKEVFIFARQSDRVPLIDVKKNIIPAILQVTENEDISKLFAELQSKDDYTFRHNIAVGVISTLIGKWLQLSQSELSILTLAATLHDIGKTKIPNEILNNPGKFTNEEFTTMKKHTIYGYELLKNTVGASHRVGLVALQHHEREDGSGYPFGLQGDKMDYLSKIVAVADVFHAMTSKRVYRDAAPFYEVITQMREDRFGRLDNKIISLFLQKIMEMQIGNDAVLSDGRRGKIVMIHQDDPANPLIQIGDDYVDLSNEPSLNLQQVFIV